MFSIYCYRNSDILKHGLVLDEQLAHLHTENTDKASNIASDENIMENNYIFVMLWFLKSQ